MLTPRLSSIRLSAENREIDRLQFGERLADEEITRDFTD